VTEKLDEIDKEAEIVNQVFWDEMAPIHYKSYDIEKLKKVKSLIDEIQKKEIGNVKDKSLLYLQCHIGTDSLKGFLVWYKTRKDGGVCPNTRECSL